jgi:hypothetical protein
MAKDTDDKKKTMISNSQMEAVHKAKLFKALDTPAKKTKMIEILNEIADRKTLFEQLELLDATNNNLKKAMVDTLSVEDKILLFEELDDDHKQKMLVAMDAKDTSNNHTYVNKSIMFDKMTIAQKDVMLPRIVAAADITKTGLYTQVATDFIAKGDANNSEDRKTMLTNMSAVHESELFKKLHASETNADPKAKKTAMLAALDVTADRVSLFEKLELLDAADNNNNNTLKREMLNLTVLSTVTERVTFFYGNGRRWFK